ncbi:MAG: ABC transporter ATP-binding protein [Pirellulales bacterium]
MVLLTMLQLGLAGLGIDVIGWEYQHRATPDPWPWGIRPPADWGPVASITAIAAGILLVSALHVLMKYRSTVALTRLAQQKIVYRLRTDVYDKLQRLSFRFFDANQSGTIINRVTGDVQAVRMFIDGVLIQVITVVISLGIYLAYMLSIAPGLTAACLATTPLLWIGAAILLRMVRPAYQVNSALVDHVMLVLSENVQGQSVVKGFGRADVENAKFDRASRGARSERRHFPHHRLVSTDDGDSHADQHGRLVGLRRLFGHSGRNGARDRVVRLRQSAATVRQSNRADHQHRQLDPSQPDRRATRLRDSRRAVGSRTAGRSLSSRIGARRSRVRTRRVLVSPGRAHSA